MKFSEIANNYVFNDSIFEGIYFDKENNIIKVEIELCNWKQANYKDNDPEMINMLLIFNGVYGCKLDPEQLTLDSDEILNVEVSDNDTTLKFVIYNEEIKTIEITADDVEVLI